MNFQIAEINIAKIKGSISTIQLYKCLSKSKVIPQDRGL
jgi:hypothetical protein